MNKILSSPQTNTAKRRHSSQPHVPRSFLPQSVLIQLSYPALVSQVVESSRGLVRRALECSSSVKLPGCNSRSSSSSYSGCSELVTGDGIILINVKFRDAGVLQHLLMYVQARVHRKERATMICAPFDVAYMVATFATSLYLKS